MTALYPSDGLLCHPRYATIFSQGATRFQSVTEVPLNCFVFLGVFRFIVNARATPLLNANDDPFFFAAVYHPAFF